MHLITVGELREAATTTPQPWPSWSTSFPHPNGTIAHLDVLPGAIDNYLALARRVTATA